MNEHSNFPNLNGTGRAIDPFVPPDPPTEQPTSAREVQAARMLDMPAVYTKPLERLAVELALGMDEPEDIFHRYGYTPDQATDLMATPAFTILLARIGAEVRESGLSFRMKAKAISEESLGHAWDIMTDPLQSAAVRADLIKWASKVAGNEPAPAKPGAGEGMGGFNLSITFTGQPPQQIISGHEPITIEQGA